MGLGAGRTERKENEPCPHGTPSRVEADVSRSTNGTGVTGVSERGTLTPGVKGVVTKRQPNSERQIGSAADRAAEQPVQMHT